MKFLPAFLRCTFVPFSILAATSAAPPVDSVVSFNEISYHPATEGASQWVELHNQMAVRMDISKWSLTGAIQYQFAEGTVIEPNGHLVIAETPGTSGIPGALGPWIGQMKHGGDTIQLRDNNKRLMDQLSYDDNGKWPVAADGTGLTLSKRTPRSGSPNAENWTTSEVIGGSPGVENFATPNSTQTLTHAITQADTWKYNDSGEDLGTNWRDLAYNDTAWPSGQAGFTYGGGTLYSDAPLPKTTGRWSTTTWTGDANSQISSSKTYTHKVALNRTKATLPINGVAFVPGTATGQNWNLYGTSNASSTNAANPMPAGTGSRQLCDEFYFGVLAGATYSALEITGLTPGVSYVTTFYVVSYESSGTRLATITPSDSLTGTLIDEGSAGIGKGTLVKYHFKCPAGGRISYRFEPLSYSATWHHYAFSNELAPEFPAESAVAGVTVGAVSSEQTASGLEAVNLTNGSGLNASGNHTTTASGSMWLSNGTAGSPANPLPASVTFDLGSPKNISSLDVWNYNQAAGNTTAAGAKDVEIQTSSSLSGPYTTAATVQFSRAFGITSEIGEKIPLTLNAARFVKLNILSNWGAAGDIAGLSEIKFFSPIPAPLPTVYRTPIPSLRSTGMNDRGNPLPVGSPETHYTQAMDLSHPTVMSRNTSWASDDGLSQWVGLTSNGNTLIPAGIRTYSTSFDLTGYRAGTADIKVYVAADDFLYNFKLNGTLQATFSLQTFLEFAGPFALTSPLNPGLNTIEFDWHNGTPPVAATAGGFRVRWDATAEPVLDHTTLAANPVTSYFRKKFSLSGNPNSAHSLSMELGADDGAIVYVNGIECHRTNLPAGPVTAATLASENIVYPRLSSLIPLAASSLNPIGENVVSVELHQASGGGDAYFHLALDVLETPVVTPVAPPVLISEISGAAAGISPKFVELRNLTNSAISLDGYSLGNHAGSGLPLDGLMLPPSGYLVISNSALNAQFVDGEKMSLFPPGGTLVADTVRIKPRNQARSSDDSWLHPSSATPGTANAFVISTDVVINEIMYHHASSPLETGVIENPEEWIELYNRGASAVDLSGWKLDGGIEFVFPPGTTLATEAYLVVAKDAGTLAASHPGIAVVGNYSKSLSDKSDTIRLEDANGNPVNQVHYKDSGRWDHRADGGGSSLELRNPFMDNSLPEAWAASDESAKSTWQNFTYTASGAPPAGGTEPTAAGNGNASGNDAPLFSEFIFGLLDAGEFLIDDIVVSDNISPAVNLIQNGTFASGAPDKWRLLGTHGAHAQSVVVGPPGDQALKVVASGSSELMHNHCETTLKNGANDYNLSNTRAYAISFRAKWISGSPRLTTRLYLNRAARQHLLSVPSNNGTPGAPNSRLQSEALPAVEYLTHSPAVPPLGSSVSVMARVSKIVAPSAVTLHWTTDPPAAVPDSAPMSVNASGLYEASIPAQAADTLIQYWVTVSSGALETSFPAGGVAQAALVKWNDGFNPVGPARGLRILMRKADTDFMHSPTQALSNHFLPCTIIDDETEIFTHAGCRLRSSESGRTKDTRLGFALEFDPTHLFRGVHRHLHVDRSSLGQITGNGNGQIDLLMWQFLNHAGGVPSMYNDFVYLIPPRQIHAGSASLGMAEYGDIYLDSQYENGAASPVHKLEIVYYPYATTDGTREGLKLAEPFERLGLFTGKITASGKEAHRTQYLIGNALENDDYTSILKFDDLMTLIATSPQPSAPAQAVIESTLDLNQWLRASAAMALINVSDNYSTGSKLASPSILNTEAARREQHNLKLYTRGSDGRILYFPWDIDYTRQDAATFPIEGNVDLRRIFAADNGSNKRLFYSYLHEMLSTSYNVAYLSSWVEHYKNYNQGGENWDAILGYVQARAASVTASMNTAFPPTAFSITTNAGDTIVTSESFVMLEGRGGLDLRGLRLDSSSVPLQLTWTSSNTWRTSVPVMSGAHDFTLLALDHAGNPFDFAVITIIGEGDIIPATHENLVISEIHYHPSDLTKSEEILGFANSDDFEFLELRNISASDIDLSGCRFTKGIEYTFPQATTLSPHDVLILPRNRTALLHRTPSAKIAVPEYAIGNTNKLNNAGEDLELLDATGLMIQALTYGTSNPWPTGPDGIGPSLVLIAPELNPDPNLAINWRASFASHGNPGGGDALPPLSDPSGDDNHNGLPNFVDAIITTPLQINGAAGAVTFERNPSHDLKMEILMSTDLQGWLPVPKTWFSRNDISPTKEAWTITIQNPGERHFIQARVVNP